MSKLNFLSLREKAGWFSGYGLGLMTGLTALVRRSRTFHPRGLTYHAQVTVVPNSFAAFDSSILAGNALVRLSSAWWKKVEAPDVLGIAVRFTQSRPLRTEVSPEDQDLLFATIKYPWTTPLGPLTTDFRNFMANEYYAVSPFGMGQQEKLFKFKLKHLNAPTKDIEQSRTELLEEAVKFHQAVFAVMVQEVAEKSWHAVAQLSLDKSFSCDQETLRFSPFQNGLNINPRGYVHFLRIGAYRMSQAVRPTENIG